MSNPIAARSAARSRPRAEGCILALLVAGPSARLRDCLVGRCRRYRPSARCRKYSTMWKPVRQDRAGRSLPAAETRSSFPNLRAPQAATRKRKIDETAKSQTSLHFALGLFALWLRRRYFASAKSQTSLHFALGFSYLCPVFCNETKLTINKLWFQSTTTISKASAPLSA